MGDAFFSASDDGGAHDGGIVEIGVDADVLGFGDGAQLFDAVDCAQAG